MPFKDSIAWLKDNKTWNCFYKGEIQRLTDFFDFIFYSENDKQALKFVFSKNLLHQQIVPRDTLKVYGSKLVSVSDYSRSSRPNEYKGYVIISDFQVANIEEDTLKTDLFNLKFGVVDKHYNILCPPVLDRITVLNDNYAVGKISGRSGIVYFSPRKSNHQLSSVFVFDNFIFSKDQDIKASIGGKWGLLSKNLDTLISFDFDSIGVFNEELVCVKKDGLCGFNNRKNLRAIDCKYLSASCFTNGYSVVQNPNSNMFMYIDKYDKAIQFVENDSIQLEWQYADKIVLAYDNDDYEYKIAKVLQNNEYSLWQFDGSIAKPYIKLKYDDIEVCHENLDVVYTKKNSKYGIIYKHKEVIPPQYDEQPYYIDDGYFRVIKNKKAGVIYITNDGNIINTIPIKYSGVIGNYYDRYCIVRNDNGKYGLFDYTRNGHSLVLKCEYSDIHSGWTNRPSFYIENNNGHTGVFDGKNWILYPNYSSVYIYEDYIEYGSWSEGFSTKRW